MFCLKCADSQLVERKETFEGEARGESFEIRCDGMVCPQCGFKTLTPHQMDDFRTRLSDAYRRKHGLLTSKQIIGYREALDMSQEEFAGYLGVGIASLKRWELGKIQDPSSDELIRLKADPGYAERNSVDVLYQQHAKDEFHGNRTFDQSKFDNVVVYCVTNIPNISPLFLNKALFYIDFLHYKHFKVSVTGCPYAALDYGPCPDQYQSLFRKLFDRKLFDKGIIQQKDRHVLKTHSSCDLSLFSDSEKQTLDYVAGLFRRDRQKYYRMSHEEEGWKKTPDFKLIDYQYASKLKISLPRDR